jgi:hypothetical protein
MWAADSDVRVVTCSPRLYRRVNIVKSVPFDAVDSWPMHCSGFINAALHTAISKYDAFDWTGPNLHANSNMRVLYVYL